MKGTLSLKTILRLLVGWLNNVFRPFQKLFTHGDFAVKGCSCMVYRGPYVILDTKRQLLFHLYQACGGEI